MREKNQAKAPRRPNRLLLVLMCALIAVAVALNVLLIGVVSPYFGIIGTFVSGAPESQEIDEAGEASAALTEEIESEGIILLKNEGDALPLSGDGKVNVLGASSEQFVYGGTGSGAGDSENVVTFLQGLENAGLTPNPELVTFYRENSVARADMGLVGTDWGIYELPAADYDQTLIDAARAYSDTAVVVISRAGGESTDLPLDMEGYTGGAAGQSYLELTQDEKDLLALAEENFGTVVVVLNAANPMELGWLESEDVDAAIWVGFPGSSGCNAIGDVLVGNVNPSGRTVDTFAYEVESAPSYYSFGDYDYTNAYYANTTIFAGTGTAVVGDDPYHYVD